MNNLKTVFLIKPNRSAYLRLACAHQSEWRLAFRMKTWLSGRNPDEF